MRILISCLLVLLATVARGAVGVTPGGGGGGGGGVTAAQVTNTVNVVAPSSMYVNFGAYTNIGPAPIFKGMDGQGYVTVGGASNCTFISNGVFSSYFENVTTPVSAASYIWTTNSRPTDFMWLRGRYKNVSAAGVSAPLAVMICANQSMDNSGVAGVWNPIFHNLTHVTIMNGEVSVQLWGAGSIVYSTNFYFNPGWLLNEERMVGFYYGDNTLTVFGYSMAGVRGVTVSNSLFNTYRPTNGNPSYLAWESYLGSASSNLQYNIEFTEIGAGNFGALNQLLPQWNEQFRNTSAYVATDSGTASNMTATGSLVVSGNQTNTGNYYSASGGITLGSGAITLTGNGITMGSGNQTIAFSQYGGDLVGNGLSRVKRLNFTSTSASASAANEGSLDMTASGTVALTNRLSITNLASSGFALAIRQAASNGVVSISGITNATPTTPGSVAAWIPVTLNGTNGFVPFYQ